MIVGGKQELFKKLELGLIPNDEVKKLMRIQLARRLQWGYKSTYEEQIAQVLDLTHSLRHMNIAMEVDTLDSNMYEVPLDFLKIMNGSALKMSSCYFKDDSTTLDEAEIAMMDLHCERAQIKDGHSVLDLGCGHGSLTFYVAQKYKKSHVTAVTNSVSQKEYIEEEARRRNLSNVEVLLADIATHEMADTYDRILVVGLFEHMKNYGLLLKKISEWMAKDGLLFVQHVCHKTFAFHCEPIDEDDWLSEYAFPAGTMIIPSASFFLYFQDDASVVNHWTLSGKHFSRTTEEWLKRLDANVKVIIPMFATITGSEEEAVKLLNYWRGLCFFGVELYGYNNGEEWMESHVLFKKK
uniref:Putative N-methyltransferase n=1 Tax=Thalictrum flavum TaxID=150094 RepID=C3SBV9_9MAGN|nr:putative N-methyltransferase [Thalictrum flavum]